MDLAEFIQCGTLAHGHACPPLVLGVRAGAVAMARLGVGRALDRELFAFVELGSDHYAQGFVDGVQVVTGCTFGKDLIIRLPHGKASLRLVDQAGGKAVRIATRPETIAALERSEWFRACSASGNYARVCADLGRPLVEEFLAATDDALFSLGPVFPLSLVVPPKVFETVACEACGESVLASYVHAVDGKPLCVSCEERKRARVR
jgi:formylmethanofuran dehydrogenase subunit E